MKRLIIVTVVLLVLVRSRSHAAGPDYLLNNREPVDQVSQLATPFTPLTVGEPQLRFFDTTNFAGQPFIQDSEFGLQPRLYYRSLQNGSGVNNTFAGGGEMDFTSGWWCDMVQLGVAGYTTQPIANNQNDVDRTGLVAPDGQGFTTLGQAWAKLKAGPATATLYRQVLELPFMHADDSRMVPNTFEAYQVDVKPLDYLQCDLGYVSQIKPRNSSDFISMSQAAGAPQIDRGTSFASFVLGSEAGTYLEAVGEVTWDLYCCTYVQAGHTWQVTPDFGIRGDAQFVDQQSVGGAAIGNFETHFYGTQLAASYGGAVLSAAFTDTASGAGVFDPYGADPGFNGMMIGQFASADEKAYGVGLSYNFARIGLKGLFAFSNFTYGTLPSDAWQHEVNVTVGYRVSTGLLKNLGLRVRYGQLQSSGQVTVDDFRVIANYSATF
jgi:hypothetical protein